MFDICQESELEAPDEVRKFPLVHICNICEELNKKYKNNTQLNKWTSSFVLFLNFQHQISGKSR